MVVYVQGCVLLVVCYFGEFVCFVLSWVVVGLLIGGYACWVWLSLFVACLFGLVWFNGCLIVL